jgi:hypothetical protein
MLVRDQRPRDRRLCTGAVESKTDDRLRNPGSEISEEELGVDRLHVEPLRENADVRTHSSSITETSSLICVPGTALPARATASPIRATAPSCPGWGASRWLRTTIVSGWENDWSTASYASAEVSPPTGTPPIETPAAIVGSGVVVPTVVVVPVVAVVARADSGPAPEAAAAASKPAAASTSAKTPASAPRLTRSL